MSPNSCSLARWSLAQRALACSKPRGRTLEQIHLIADLLTYQAVFQGLEREDLLAIAYFIESRHCEAGECVLSKGQPLEQWCLLLSGSALLTRYSTQRGAEQVTSQLGTNDSWSEAALLHSTHPRRSSVTVVAGPQGCMTLRLRYSDYDAMNDLRNPLQLLPPEGTQGAVAVPEIASPQRKASSIALLCCCLRRLASARPPDSRTPEEASELEPFLASLPAYKGYPPELVSCLAAACRSQSLPPYSLVYEHGTLADAQVTVLSGEVQLRKLGKQPEEADGDAAAPVAAAAAATVAGSVAEGTSGGAAGGAAVRPAPPGQKPEEASEPSGGRLNIRARLRREREARKLMQRQLDEYVSRMDSEHPNGASSAASASSAGPSSSAPGADGKDRSSSSIKDAAGASPMDWTRVFMQKAMRTVEPVWKALHPADKAPRRRHGGRDSTFDIPLGEGPITEVAQLLGPAAAKAYYRGLQSQGYSDSEDKSGHGGAFAIETGGGGGGGSRGSGRRREGSARDRWRRWMFSVDGPETPKERTLRNMAMRASRIYREQHARSRGSGFDADEVDEMYGAQYATLTRGSPVGELSTVTLHSTMRKESAVAGPGGCELLLVDWEAFQQGVLAARAAVLARAAPFLTSLPKERLTELAELCLCLSVDAGTLLARQGSPLECMVVVQDGEVTLFHEPSAALHTRISTIRGQAVTRSRNGRTQLWPLLATLSSSFLPSAAAAAAATADGAATAASTAAGGAATPAGSGGGGGVASGASTPVPPAGSGGSFTGAPGIPGPPMEVTIQGLPLGELGVGGILGEAILGARSSGAGAPPNGHLDPIHRGQGHGHGPRSYPGGEAHPHPHSPSQSVTAAVLAAMPAASAEGPKWPATVLAARASVLLVIPRSVLYMSEFDLIRSDLIRFATERRTWLSRRVEAAYRAAAAPTTTPAVFANSAGAAAAAAAATAAANGPTPPPMAPQQPLPSLRRPGLPSADGGGGRSGSPTPHIGSFPRRAASSDVSAASAAASLVEPGGSSGAVNTHYPLSRRRSVESMPRSTSPAHAAAAAAATPSAAAAAAGASARSATKWDFLDAPTGGGAATSANVTSAGMEPSASLLALPLAPSGGSFSRGGMSLLDSAGSIVMPSSFISGSAPLRRGSKDAAAGSAAAAAAAATAAASVSIVGSLNGGGGADYSGLSPVQQAIMEAGLDPQHFLGAEASSAAAAAGGGGSATGLERHCSVDSSSVAPLPALTPQGSGAVTPPPRGLAPLVVAGGGGGGGGSGSPATSTEFDALRVAGPASPFRAPNALTPSNRRSTCGSPGPIPPAFSAPVYLLDSGYGGAGGAISPSSPMVSFPSAAVQVAMRAVRGSQCGTARARRRTDMDGSGGAGATPAPPSGALTAPPPALSPRIPALQALDAIENATAATAATPGLFGRNSRGSYTGGVTPRIASVDSLWVPAGSRAGFLGGLRGAGASGRGATRDGGVVTEPSLMLTDAEAEEEAALARSLVPKNQAGMFMVRGGVSSTPAKQPAVRRIAGCF